MKKTVIAILVIILLVSIQVLGTACKNEAPVKEEAVEKAIEEAPTEEEAVQTEEATEEEPLEEAITEEVQEEVIEEEIEAEMYSLGSKMEDLLDNPVTMEIMQKYIPDIVNSDRIDESRSYALSLVLNFQGVEEDILNQLDADLSKIEVPQ